MTNEPFSCEQPRPNLEQLCKFLVTELKDYAVFLVDRNGCISSWNEGVRRILRYNESEFVRRPFEMIFTPEDRDRGAPQQEIQIAAKDGRSDDERWHMRKDGSRFWCDGVLTALNADDGTLLGYAKVMRDATRRKEAENALRESEERLQAALEASNTGTFRWIISTNEVMADENLTELFGLPRQRRSFIVDDFMNLIHTDDRGEVQEGVRRCRDEGADLHCEFRAVPPDGAVRWILAQGKAVRDADGRPEYMTGACIDINDRKVVEDERERLLAESAQRTAELNAIFTSMPDAVYVGDLTGIKQCNDLAVRMLGFSTRQDLDQKVGRLAELIRTRHADSGEVITEDQQPFTRALRGEAVAEDVTVTNLKTGEEVTVRSAAAPVIIGGQVRGAVAINTDITARKNAEKERERLVKALQRSNEELSDFAHVVSHDLQAPLRTITTFAQLLQRKNGDNLDAKSNEYIESIVDASASMHQLIQALLQFAEAGGNAKPAEETPLGGVVEAVIDNLQTAIQESGAMVTCTSQLPIVMADRVQLGRVLQNLIGNALKYRRPDARPEVTVSAHRDSDEWVVAIHDNGMGIDQKHFARIFEPLKRLHGREIPGSGIGLAVCKKIIENLGGRMWVESEPGRGSTFYFTLLPVSTALS